ncbi:MAG: ImmA/IrrE family metallo-endopeptidase [Clostridiales bacterium]|jgi:Zn-dependent peptidase ImmA (M78 family)|nr:ImmA/IrrE family metallo-endopeptidase [Clostridiales bacterium]
MGAKKYAYLNPTMLKWARSETPFKTINDVIARRPRYTYEQIEAWENGNSYPTITEAKDLAALYDVPFACLFFTEIPAKKPRPYTDRRTAYTHMTGEVSYELWREIRRITTNREIALDTDSEFFLNTVPLPVITYGEITSSVASKIRSYFGLVTPFKYKNQYKNSAFNYFRSILENKNIMVSQITDVSVSEIRGLSICNDIMPIIAVNSNDWERAKVFTLFHEMAHLLRRSSSLCLIDFDEHNDAEEKICDKIAAEVLLPENSFRKTVSEMGNGATGWDNSSLMNIADKFAVSTVVVLRRLYELRIISFDYYVSRYKEMEADVIRQVKNKKQFPVKYHYRYLNQQGYLFPRIMLSAYANGNISYGEMCRTLNVNTIHIGNIEKAVMYG